LAAALLVGLALNAAFGWWWADEMPALALLNRLMREAREALASAHSIARPGVQMLAQSVRVEHVMIV
jgi:hypothetical protein